MRSGGITGLHPMSDRLTTRTRTTSMPEVRRSAGRTEMQMTMPTQARRDFAFLTDCEQEHCDSAGSPQRGATLKARSSRIQRCALQER
jgi:hypothetical protein